jgi:hypothetical protein
LSLLYEIGELNNTYTIYMLKGKEIYQNLANPINQSKTRTKGDMKPEKNKYRKIHSLSNRDITERKKEKRKENKERRKEREKEEREGKKIIDSLPLRVQSLHARRFSVPVPASSRGPWPARLHGISHRARYGSSCVSFG